MKNVLTVYFHFKSQWNPINNLSFFCRFISKYLTIEILEISKSNYYCDIVL